MTKPIRHVAMLPDSYAVSVMQVPEAMAILQSRKPHHAVALAASTTSPTCTVLHPTADGANKVLSVDKSVRFGHAADMTSIQEMLDRVTIPHYLFDGGEESFVAIPQEYMQLVNKMFECNAILFK